MQSVKESLRAREQWQGKQATLLQLAGNSGLWRRAGGGAVLGHVCAVPCPLVGLKVCLWKAASSLAAESRNFGGLSDAGRSLPTPKRGPRLPSGWPWLSETAILLHPYLWGLSLESRHFAFCSINCTQMPQVCPCACMLTPDLSCGLQTKPEWQFQGQLSPPSPRGEE